MNRPVAARLYLKQRCIRLSLMSEFSVYHRLLHCPSSHSGAVSVGGPAEVLPADHPGHPGGGPPPHEGKLLLHLGQSGE